MCKTRFMLTMLAAAFAVGAHARAATEDAAGGHGRSVVVDCTSKHEPGLADVSEVVGTGNNFWASFSARQRLVNLAKPACARGSDGVQFVRLAQGSALANAGEG